MIKQRLEKPAQLTLKQQEDLDTLLLQQSNWQEIKHRAEVKLDEIKIEIQALGGNTDE